MSLKSLYMEKYAAKDDENGKGNVVEELFGVPEKGTYGYPRLVGGGAAIGGGTGALLGAINGSLKMTGKAGLIGALIGAGVGALQETIDSTVESRNPGVVQRRTAYMNAASELDPMDSALTTLKGTAVGGAGGALLGGPVGGFLGAVGGASVGAIKSVMDDNKAMMEKGFRPSRGGLDYVLTPEAEKKYIKTANDKFMEGFVKELANV